MILRFCKKIVWTLKLGLLAADPVSFLKITFYSLRIPLGNRFHWTQKPYSWNIRVRKHSTKIYCDGTYEELLLLTEVFIDKVYALPSFISHSIQTIVDGGANVGFTSIFYAFTYPNATVYSFEPEPNTFQLLKKNISNIPTKNIVIFQSAIAEAKKTIDFFVHPTKNISSSIFERNISYSKIQVPAIGLDDVFELISLHYIDVLKLDVEGAEFDILQSSKRLSDVGFITSEIHADIVQKDPKEIVQALEMSHLVVLEKFSHTNRFLCQAIPRTNKINVTFILPSLLIGGIESHFAKQTHYFNQDVFKISVVSLFDYPSRENIKHRLNPSVLIHPMDFKALSFDSWKLVYQTVKQLEPHVLVSSMFSGNTMSRVLGFLLKVPVIAREHNVYSEKNIFQRIVDHFFALFSYCIVAVSRSVRNFAHKQARIPLDRFVVINNGVDLAQASKYKNIDIDKKKEIRKSLEVAEDAFVFLHIARMKEQKNQKFLLKEFALITKKYPQAFLCIVGDGKERKDLEKFSETLGLSKKVHFFGYRQDVEMFYACADAFVLTSTREGFPNVIVEALSFGLPILSTPVSGTDEIFEHKEIGYIVKGTEGSLVDAADAVINWSAEKRAQVSRHAQEAATFFSIEKNVAAYENLFIKAFLSKKYGK